MGIEVAETQGRLLTGWGRAGGSYATVVRSKSEDELASAIVGAGERGVIARGLGRSYGDPAQNGGGVVVDMTKFDSIINVDSRSGLVEVEAGVSLDSLMKVALPFGLWVPVLPGTRQVTVGGAIASDIHGKNHHSAGSFGNHVVALDLMMSDGEVRQLTPDGSASDLFWATVGGMGLTGVILRAVVRMTRTETAYFLVDNERSIDLNGTIDLLSNGSDEAYDYSVAVPDTVSTDSRLGRAGFSRGSLASIRDLPARLQEAPLKFSAPQLITLPDIFPNGLVNNFTVGLASKVAYRAYSKHSVGKVQNLTQFYHPLDLVGEWNRAYGSKGFLQYQFSVPLGREDCLREMIVRIAKSGQRSFLNVLKRMGPENRAQLSWPHPGYMLSVDFAIRDGLAEFCDELDEHVMGFGGRLYFAKDSRTRSEWIPQMYPELDSWRRIRDIADPNRVFVSDQARRLCLIQ